MERFVMAGKFEVYKDKVKRAVDGATVDDQTG